MLIVRRIDYTLYKHRYYTLRYSIYGTSTLSTTYHYMTYIMQSCAIIDQPLNQPLLCAYGSHVSMCTLWLVRRREGEEHGTLHQASYSLETAQGNTYRLIHIHCMHRLTIQPTTPYLYEGGELESTYMPEYMETNGN